MYGSSHTAVRPPLLPPLGNRVSSLAQCEAARRVACSSCLSGSRLAAGKKLFQVYRCLDSTPISEGAGDLPAQLEASLKQPVTRTPRSILCGQLSSLAKTVSERSCCLLCSYWRCSTCMRRSPGLRSDQPNYKLLHTAKAQDIRHSLVSLRKPPSPAASHGLRQSTTDKSRLSQKRLLGQSTTHEQRLLRCLDLPL